jgi:hypothetical protein
VNNLIEELRTDINKTIDKYIFKNNNNVQRMLEMLRINKSIVTKKIYSFI